MGVIDRVVVWLRELFYAPQGSIASRLCVGRVRDPHEEISFYREPKTERDVVHSLESIFRSQSFG
jgi:hypothetical protein